MTKTGSSAYPESACSYYFYSPPEGLSVLRKYLPQSTYARNAITLMRHTAFAQALLHIARWLIHAVCKKPELFGPDVHV